jgi:hypothetical protein
LRQSFWATDALRFAAEARFGMTRNADRRDDETQDVTSGYYGALALDMVQSLFARPNAPIEYISNVTWTYLATKTERDSDKSTTSIKKSQIEVRLAGLRLRF